MSLWQWTSQEASNQQFIAVQADSVYYKFISVLSGKVLATLNESTAPEAKVVLHTGTGQPSARWQLLPVPTVGNGNGLTGNYYNGMNFETFIFSRLDPTINFDWGEGSPGTGVNSNAYTVRWTGKVEPRYSGQYTFYITSDNGRRLWVNNQLIIDKWLDDWDIEYSGNITLTAGQQYDIKLEYFENNGGANCKLSWSSALQGKEIIPKNQLYATSLTLVNSSLATAHEQAITRKDIVIYPNPAATHVRLKFNAKQVKIIIYDALGRQVTPARLVYPGQEISTAQLRPGVYLIQIDINGVKTTKHLVKSAE